MELANRTKRVHKSQLHQHNVRQAFKCVYRKTTDRGQLPFQYLELSSKGNHPEPDNNPFCYGYWEEKEPEIGRRFAKSFITTTQLWD